LVYPESKIEVVNIALTAVNSYTIRDLFPGVLEQKPDLIIIYTGHNEYYGALGVGSTESLGNSRFLVNTALYLNRFKTFGLIRNIIKSVMGIFNHNSSKAKGTLMSRIVKDQYIPFNSRKYEAGIEQFKGNLKDILEMAKEKKVPVILGTLASNLKDQPPFISIKDNNLPPAEELFKKAQLLLKQNKTKEAIVLFKKAKDLDALRFRAPEEINKIILNLGKEYHAGIIDIDSVFNTVSPDGITGNNLMTDHLHPTLGGYQLIGKLYYEKMEQMNILPSTKEAIAGDHSQDSAALADFDFSKLDSTIADFRIKYLKNDWPFIEKDKVKPPRELFGVYNIIDTTAVEVVDGTLEWEKAERRIAGWYLHKQDIRNFTRQMNVLISQYPFYIELYDLTIKELLQLKKFDDAYSFLYRRFKNKPDAFSAKWLGIIDLSKGNTDKALNYLQESLKYNNSDTQVLYNLSGAYLYKKQYDKALSTINLCLSYDPDYAGARQMQGQLIAMVHK
jgi:tetratricopeptide (TPR) repeat protein